MTNEDLRVLFIPQHLERAAEIRDCRLAHYTTAETAFKIISHREVWLRNALLMNDFSQIHHGLACPFEAWASPAGMRLQNWLETTRPGLKARLVHTFDSHTYGIRAPTYMMSLSQHHEDEDRLGRLSMWRAYGKRAGVAMVLNNTKFLSELMR